MVQASHVFTHFMKFIIAYNVQSSNTIFSDNIIYENSIYGIFRFLFAKWNRLNEYLLKQPPHKCSFLNSNFVNIHSSVWCLLFTCLLNKVLLAALPPPWGKYLHLSWKLWCRPLLLLLRQNIFFFHVSRNIFKIQRFMNGEKIEFDGSWTPQHICLKSVF